MLHRNMSAYLTQPALTELPANHRHAQTVGDLIRLALLASCAVCRWARAAGEAPLANRAVDRVFSSPFASLHSFLEPVTG